MVGKEREQNEKFETVKVVSEWSTREHKAKIYGKWKDQYTFLLDRRHSLSSRLDTRNEHCREQKSRCAA